jgi:predicted metal-dependent phosphoesterase TrpH
MRSMDDAHTPALSGRADLHLHPGGDRSAREAAPTIFLDAIRRSGLHVAALTDHDRLDFARALIAEAEQRGLPVELVLGEEVSTRDGHVLAIGIRASLPPHRTLGETIAAVHDQGALAIVAHPMLPTRISVGRRLLEELAGGPAERRPDAIEAFNPMANWLPFYGRRVRELARRCGYPAVGGSDGHRVGHIARGHTAFQGRTFSDLRRSIADGEVEALGRPFDLPDVIAGVTGQILEGLIRPGRG